VQLIRANSYGTSKYCTTCSKEHEFTSGNYNLQYCPKYKKNVNRHENAATNTARHGQDEWENYLASLSATT